MYAGQIVEQATVEELFEDPQHPYTWGLLGSVPRLDRPRSERLPTIGGSTPSLLNPVKSCRFAPRCPHAFGRCEEVPIGVSGAGPARAWRPVLAQCRRQAVFAPGGRLHRSRGRERAVFLMGH